MKKKVLPTGLAGVLFVVAAVASFAQSGAQTTYTGKCQPCHGPTGSGQTAVGRMFHVKSFNDPSVTSMTDTALNGVITSGVGKMPAYQNVLSNDQITALVQYLHQLQQQLPAN